MSQYSSSSSYGGKILAGVVAFLVLCGIFVAVGSFESVSASEVLICQQGGPFDDRSVGPVVDPGSGMTNVGISSDCHALPVGARTYEYSRDNDADGPAIICTTSDSVEMRFQGTLRFSLNTEDHEFLEEAFTEVFSKYKAWSDDGWDEFLDETARRELEATIIRECRNYDGLALSRDRQVLEEIDDAIAQGLRTRINDELGMEIFCGPSVQYGDDECPELANSLTAVEVRSSRTRNSFEKPEREAAETRAAEQSVDTATQQALAIQELNEALASSGEDYALLRMIEACERRADACPDFWIVPQGEDLTLTTPPSG